MSKQIPDLVELQKQDVSNDDLLLIRDVSENRDKKASIGDLVGRPREGWIVPVGDSWSYESFDSSSQIGVVNVNSGAEEIYTIGMRVKFVQSSTLKYGVITAVTDDTLDIFLINDVDLEDAAITGMQYSQSFAPSTEDGANFLATMLTGQIDGLPVMLAVKNSETDPDVPAKPGFVILEAILGDEV